MTILFWRIVFFGTPSFAVPTLKGLLEGPDEVTAVVTQPDRKKGRGQKVTFSPVKELVSQYRQREVLIFQPEKVREDVIKEFVSIEQARKVYKVVLDPKTLEVDEKATKVLRSRSRKRA